MNSPFQKILILFFASILAGIVAVSIVSYKCAKAFKNTTYWVKHTQKVLDESEQILLATKDLQLESAGFYFTNNSRFLSPYTNAKKEALDHVRILKELTQGDRPQQRRIERLRVLINTLITFSDLYIPPTEANDRTYKTRIFRIEIEDILTAIRKEEKARLAVKEMANAKSIDNAWKLFYVLIVIIFILLIGSFVSTSYHINKRKIAEEGLRKSDARFRLLVDNIKEFAIFMIDKNGNIINWYSAAEYLKGYSKDEVIGKSISIFYTPEELQKGRPEYNLKMAAEKGSYETQGWRVRKDGSKFWADAVYRAIYNEQGEVLGFTKVTRDYTLHKKAEDEILKSFEKEKELNEMKSNFVTMASHEFRTPLSSILSSAGLISRYTTAEQQDKRERHIERIKSSVASLTAILEEFLSLEKIEKGKVETRFETFNLKEFIERLAADLKNVAKEGQTITSIYNGEEQVTTDSAFVRRILTDLTSNAIKYSEENSPVTIETQVLDGTITLFVKDNGMGISKEDQKHLFSRFFRAATVSNIPGTGLGLHIVKRYLDMIGGAIKVNSELGKGSEFIVEIKNLHDKH